MISKNEKQFLYIGVIECLLSFSQPASPKHPLQCSSTFTENGLVQLSRLRHLADLQRFSSKYIFQVLTYLFHWEGMTQLIVCPYTNLKDLCKQRIALWLIVYATNEKIRLFTINVKNESSSSIYWSKRHRKSVSHFCWLREVFNGNTWICICFYNITDLE